MPCVSKDAPVPAAADVEILKVSTKSNPNSVAGAIAGAIRSSGAVVMQVVGAGALNQAVLGFTTFKELHPDAAGSGPNFVQCEGARQPRWRGWPTHNWGVASHQGT